MTHINVHTAHNHHTHKYHTYMHGKPDLQAKNGGEISTL